MVDLLRSPVDTVAKKDVSFSAAEAKDLETALGVSCSIVSWMDLWLLAFWRAANDPSMDRSNLKRIFLSGSRALEFLAMTVNTSWGNMRLKRRDSALESSLSTLSVQEKAALRNGSLDDSGNLFPESVVRSVVESNRRRVQSAALQKVALSGSSGSKAGGHSGGHKASGSASSSGNQKSSGGASASSSGASAGKGAGQPFSKASGPPKAKVHRKKQKRGNSK